MKLSKKIPSRIETVEFLWCQKKYMVMSQAYRKARSKLRSKMDSCFWCRAKFNDGDVMALACVSGKGNKTLCQSCADKVLATKR